MEEKEIYTAAELEKMRLKEEYLKLKQEIEEEAGDSNSTTSKLVMNFQKANGDPVSMTMKYAKGDLSDANAKSLMEGIVANGTIFEKVPAQIKSAKLVTTTETAIDLS